MDKDTEKLQTDLRFAAAFLKAHEEVKANEAERQKRIYEKAVISAENRRRKKAEEEAYFENLKKHLIEPSEEIKEILRKNCGIDLDKQKTEEWIMLRKHWLNAPSNPKKFKKIENAEILQKTSPKQW